MTKQNDLSNVSIALLISHIMKQIVTCYHDDGTVAEDYTKNIKLPDISHEELTILRDVARLSELRHTFTIN